MHNAHQPKFDPKPASEGSAAAATAGTCSQERTDCRKENVIGDHGRLKA